MCVYVYVYACICEQLYTLRCVFCVIVCACVYLVYVCAYAHVCITPVGVTSAALQPVRKPGSIPSTAHPLTGGCNYQKKNLRSQHYGHFV